MKMIVKEKCSARTSWHWLWFGKNKAKAIAKRINEMGTFAEE